MYFDSNIIPNLICEAVQYKMKKWLVIFPYSILVYGDYKYANYDENILKYNLIV